MHIDAAAYSQSLSTMQVYVDGVKKYQASAGSLGQHDDGGVELQTDIVMAAGTHRITVKAWDSAGSFSKTVSATVK